MWSSIAKGAAGIAVIVLLFFMNRGNKQSNRKKYGAILAGVLIVGLLLAFYPIENIFYSFPSTEKLAEYICRGEVLGWVEGETSSLILGNEKNGEITINVAPKDIYGYKIPNAMSSELVSKINNGSYFAEIISGNGTEDCYVLVGGSSESSIKAVTDTIDSNFVVIESNISSGGKNYIQFYAYAFLGSNPNKYQITVRNLNEETIMEVGVIEGGSWSD